MIINGKFQIISIDLYRTNNKCSDDEEAKYEIEATVYDIKEYENKIVRGANFSELMDNLILHGEVY
jgi:hypothetical protein